MSSDPYIAHLLVADIDWLVSWKNSWPIWEKAVFPPGSPSLFPLADLKCIRYVASATPLTKMIALWKWKRTHNIPTRMFWSPPCFYRLTFYYFYAMQHILKCLPKLRNRWVTCPYQLRYPFYYVLIRNLRPVPVSDGDGHGWAGCSSFLLNVIGTSFLYSFRPSSRTSVVVAAGQDFWLERSSSFAGQTGNLNTYKYMVPKN